MTKSFYTLLTGLLVSYIGDFLFMASISLILYIKLESVFAVATVYIVRNLASLTLLLVGGTIVDRLNAKRFIVIIDFVRSLLVLSIPFLLDFPIVLFLLVFIHGGLGSIYGTALRVVLKFYSLHFNENKVNSAFSFVFWAGAIVGTALSGFLVENYGNKIPFYFDSLSFLICGILTSLIIFKSTHNKIKHKAPGNKYFTILMEDIKSSHITIKETPILKQIVISTTLLTVSMSVASSFQVVFITDHLNLSSELYGIIKSTEMWGLLIGSIILSTVSKKIEDSNKVILSGLIIACISFLLYSFSFNLYSAVVFIFLFGLGQTIFDIASTTLTQKNVDQENIARISNFMGVAPKVTIIISLPLFSWLETLIGIKLVYIFASVLSIISIIIFIYAVYFKSNTTITEERDHHYK